MRRKDWKKKNLREDFSGRSIKRQIFKKFSLRKKKAISIRYSFLYSLETRRVKRLHKINFFPNYSIFRNFYNDFKLKKGNLLYKTKLKDSNYIITQPVYALKKQFTELRVNTINFEERYSIKSIPIFYKRLDFFKINYDRDNFRVGLNYYSFYKDVSLIENLKEDIIKDDYKNMVFIKNFNDDYKNNFIYNFHYHFNYNIFIINSVEIYKSLIFLYLNKLIIKYI